MCVCSLLSFLGLNNKNAESENMKQALKLQFSVVCNIG